jgi:hypothetical protein
MDTDTAELRTALEKWARDVEPRLLDGAGAARQLRQVARMETILASVKARLARRVEETNVWQRGGHRPRPRRPAPGRRRRPQPRHAARHRPPHQRHVDAERLTGGGEHSTANCVGTCSWCDDLVHYRHSTLEPNGDSTYHLRAPPD